jgi:UMF1 family MFS transporter
MAHAQQAPVSVAPASLSAPDSQAPARAPARERWSWALYDFANTIFSMNVATLFFAVWFVSDLGGSNTAYSAASAVASLLVALSIPVFGAVSDARQRRKPWVVGFTIVAVIATAAIGVVGYRQVPLMGDQVLGGAPGGSLSVSAGAFTALLVAYVVANYSYQGALPFYNAMLPELARPAEQGRLSGIGTALGYVGSIAGVVLGMLFFTGGVPGVLTLPAAAVEAFRSAVPFTGAAGRVSTFVPTALFFLLASLPLFFFCRDHHPRRGGAIPWRQAFADVVATVRESRRYPGALRFIVASLLYQDAMGTIISFMALYAVEAMGFARGTETTLFVVLTVPAVIGSYVCGLLVDRVGPKRTLAFVIAAWVVLLIAMVLAPSRAAFWAVGFAIGLIFGGVATAERPMLLTLIPPEESGRYFGLMVLSARAAAIIGPLLWALAVDGLTPVFGKAIAYRAAVLTVAAAMVVALLLLRGVPDRWSAWTERRGVS